MHRAILTRCLIGKIEPHYLDKIINRGLSYKDNRLFPKTVLWIP